MFWQTDLDKNQQEVLAKGLEAGKYAVSDDGHQLAYQTDGEKDAAKEIRVMDLSSGDEYSVKAAKNEAVRPLGFLNGDFPMPERRHPVRRQLRCISLRSMIRKIKK